MTTSIYINSRANGKTLKQLQAEIEELKKLKCQYKNYCTCDTEKFLQKLEKIKEIVKRYLTDCQGFTCEPMQEILQIIEGE